MDIGQDYLPTKAIRMAELKMNSVLGRELDRLAEVAQRHGRSAAVSADNLMEETESICRFCRDYHRAFMTYLEAALPQHREPVRCGPGCGNCCHHYPMSIEPFEAIYFYLHIRESDDLCTFIEECFQRTDCYDRLLSGKLKKYPDSEDKAEDEALHDYFAQGLACPFILKGGNCGVYQVRPVTCRMYFSLTPPEYCVPEFLQTEKNRNFIVYLPDDVEGTIALISAHYAPLQLAEGLYESQLQLNLMEGMFSK